MSNAVNESIMWLCPVCVIGGTAAKKEGNRMIKGRWKGKERMSGNVWIGGRLLSVSVWSFVCCSCSGHSKLGVLERVGGGGGETGWRDFCGFHFVSGYTDHAVSIHHPISYRQIRYCFQGARTQRNKPWVCVTRVRWTRWCNCCKLT
jgi:hypothetical protein